MSFLTKPTIRKLSLNTGDFVQNAFNLLNNIKTGMGIFRIPTIVIFATVSGLVIGTGLFCGIIIQGMMSYLNDIAWAFQKRRLAAFTEDCINEHPLEYVKALNVNDYCFFEKLAQSDFPMFFEWDLRDLVREIIKNPHTSEQAADRMRSVRNAVKQSLSNRTADTNDSIQKL